MQTAVFKRLPRESGIALGPILFVLAILAILAGVISAGSGGFSVAGVSDRVVADTVTQANLVRSVINQCNLVYSSNQSTLNPSVTFTVNPDPYPESYTNPSGSSIVSSAGSAVLVSSLQCNAAGSTAAIPSAPTLPSTIIGLWSTGVNLPQPTNGFGGWYYVDATGNSPSGGRCIYIQPNASSSGIADGLTRAAAKFTHATSNDGVSEVNFDSTKAHLRFVVWISAPPSTGNENSNCKPQ